MDALFLHGWGYDSRFWQGWIAALPRFLNVRSADRGYFGPSCPFSGKPPEIIFCHSQGLHRIDEELMFNSPFLVIVGGFLSFLPENSREQKRVRKSLDLMRNKIAQEPHRLLQDFYSECSSPNPSKQELPSAINTGLLYHDLVDLENFSMQPSLLCQARKILILHGNEDKIVPPAKAVELHQKLSRSLFTVISGLGHVFTHDGVLKCCRMISDELKEF